MSTANFVHTPLMSQHQGVARAERVVTSVREMRRSFDSAQGLSTMLLAAIVAALVVAADHAIDGWAEGNAFAGWATLWIVGFCALGLFAGLARRVSHHVVKALDAWSARVAKARADERLWAIAQSDARVMADLKMAMARSEAEGARAPQQVVNRILAATAASHKVYSV